MEVSGHFTLCLGVPVKIVCPLDRDRKDRRRSLVMWAKRRDCGKLCEATILDVEFRISYMCFVCCICRDNIFASYMYIYFSMYKMYAIHRKYISCLCGILKRPGPGVDHLPLSSAEVKEWVDLHLYFPSGPSRLVLGQTLHLPLPSIGVQCSISLGICTEFMHYLTSFIISNQTAKSASWTTKRP
jgi:hypothetical protein